MVRRDPAYTRLDTEERRRRLVAQGRDLFARHAYDELSMAAIAREAGISKALLYHYFPSKLAFFVATMREAADVLAERVRPDPGRSPGAQLDHALGVWLDWVERHRDAYGRLMRGASAVPEVRQLMDGVREDAAGIVLDGLWEGDGPPPPSLRVAVHGWLGFVEEAVLDWVDRGGVGRPELHAILLEALPALAGAAGHPDAARRVRA